MAKTKIKIEWLPQPEDHNYPAAESYLGLVHKPEKSKTLVAALHKAKMTQFKAKDIFRASGLSLLGVSNSHVAKNQKKIDNGKKLSPVLLVREPKLGKIIVADGYHRICAVYTHDEDAWIPCKIV